MLPLLPCCWDGDEVLSQKQLQGERPVLAPFQGESLCRGGKLQQRELEGAGVQEAVSQEAEGDEGAVLCLLPPFDTVQDPSPGNGATYSEWAFPAQRTQSRKSLTGMPSSSSGK